MNRKHASTQSTMTTELIVAKRNRELRNAVLAVLAAAAMSPVAVQRAEAAPTTCTANGGDPTDMNCTGDQSQGVHSTRDFDPNTVDTVNVRNLTTNIQAPSLPAASRGVNYELQGPYGNGGIHDVTLNLTGTAGTPIRVTTNNASAVFVETLSGPAYDGRGATSGFLCAGAHSADEGATGATGNILNVNLSNLFLTATGANAYGVRAANSAGNGGYGGGGSMCYSSEAGGVGGHGGTLNITGTNVSIATTGADAIGISASSAGGNGGHGGDGGSFRYGSRGGIGGLGGAVNVSGSGTITTNGLRAVGIYAVSVGGNGGDGGSSSAFGGGGNGPYGVGGGLVRVDSAYTITTLQDESAGIAAYSLGGHGGNGGDGSFFNPSSGSGGGSGQSGNVWIRSTGNIVTSGIKSYGIVGQSIAGYAGSGGSANSVVNFGANGGSAGKGGRVDILNDGNITTGGQEAHAIFAESIGGGGGAGGGGFGAFYAAGGVGGSGGNGGLVFVTNTGDLRATGIDARGIYAQSIGGAGGDGGDSVGIAALGGRGADTSDGDRVTVTNSGDILSAAHAIFAESIGGGGGNGGDSAGWFSVGGGGGAGGKGGVVYVENHGALTTRQDLSSAIFAHSVGGGGGNGGSSISAGLGASFAIGGDGANGGDANSVTVISDTGSILTGALSQLGGPAGDKSHGIYAQSVGGGGGNGGYSFSGSVGVGASLSLAIGGSGSGGGAGKSVSVTNGSSIATYGDDANGIFAESVGGGGGNGGFAISVTGSQGLSAAFAVGGQGGGGGAADTVTVANTAANLATHGDRSTGLLAQSVGGGGGNGGFAVAGAFSFSVTPSGTAAIALGGNGGGGGSAKDVTVDSASNISTSGDNSTGLLAQSVGGGGGNAGFAVGASITTGAAVNASFGGKGGGGGTSGVVSVGKNAYTTGTIHTRGDNSTALLAQSVGGGGGNGGFAVSGSLSGMPSANLSVGGDGGIARNADAVSVRTASTVITEGNDSHGVVAQSVGGGGGTGGFAVSGSITASGAVGAGFGGKGGGGGSANTVTLSNIGDSIETQGDRSSGVFAQSVGGGGGNGGFAVAGSVTQGPAANFGMGGSGSQAGVGRDVFVTSTSVISTLGDESHGLFAQSVGGGGGSGGFAVAGSITASGGSLGAAIGGDGAGGGTSGRVFVNTIASGTGNISTHGDRSTGIFAQSVGGGGGAGGFAIGGNVSNGPSASLTLGGNGGTGSDSDIVFVNSGSNVSTGGDDSHGIYAQSVGGGGGSGGFAVSGSISAQGNVNAAIGGTGNGGGSAKDVTLLSSGASVSTVGTHSYGIAAQSVGGGGGDGGFSVAAGISDGATANLGIGGNGAGGGAGRGVYLSSSTAVTTQGNDSHGVFAQSVGGGGGSGGFSVAGGISRANAGASLGGKGAGGGDGGVVTLNNTATSIGTEGDHAYGVIAQSIGGGGGDGGWAAAGGIGGNGSATLALGGSGSGGGNGKSVTLTSSSNVATQGNDAHGLFAQSVGGGGGSGGFALSGALSNNAVTAALGGSGAGGGNADAVSLFNSGRQIETIGDRSYGVVAQSIGGGGGDGGFAVSGSITKGAAANFSMGGSAARGGFGSGVTLNSNSSITTQGQDSHAIFAQSVGGGGGAGGFSVAGSISADSGTVSASIGGGGGAGGTAGKVNLGNVSAIDGTLITQGARSYGILAQSVGGGGGDGGFSVAGGISKGNGAKFSMGGSGGAGNHSDTVTVRSAATIETNGDESHGIFAQSIGGGGGSGGFSVAGSISTEGSSVNASIGGSGAGGGDGRAVSVTSLGASIDTSGERAYGIVAQSVGGGGGDGGFSVAGSINKQKTINFSLGGSADVGGASGATSVFSATDITTLGAESHGIFAQSLGGGGGSGGFSVAGSLFASTTNAPSIDASIGGSGAGGGNAGAVNVGSLTNFVSGVIDVSGANAHGIFAQSIGGGGGNGGFSVAGGLNQSPAIRFSLGGSAGSASHGDAVNVFTGANITTRGDDGHGVFAQSLGGGGGNGGFSIAGSATKDTTSVNASIGGKGGGGGRGGNVGVTNSGSIYTLGDKSYGVFAQSIGGGGGNGGFSVAGGLTTPPSGLATKKPANNIEFALGGSGGNGDTGGTVTVTNTGLIDTSGAGSHGILAHSLGGGGGNGGFSGTGTLSFLGTKSAQTRVTTAVSVGGDGGVGDSGGNVGVTNARDITTRGNDARGIYAYSVGGGGGNGGQSYAIDVSLGKVENNNGWNFELAIGGKGGTGNTSGEVTVTNNGRVVTFGDRADAIYAQSIGGGGGDGGQSQAASFDFTKEKKPPPAKNGTDPWNFTTSIGGNAGSADDGNKVTITNTGNVETFGVMSRGIVAQSVGGGGGAGGNGIQGTGVDQIDTATELLDLRDRNFFSNLFDLRSWSITVGGSGGQSGDAKDVTVTNSGSIITHELSSFGIFAQSIGGGGGEAQNFAKGTGASGTAASGINSKFALGGGGGSAGDGGKVTITNTNNITTFGAESHGIFAQSIGGGGGLAGNVDRGFSSATGPIPKLNIGVGLAVGQNGGGGGDGGDVTVTNTGSITTSGSAAYGILAQSIGGGGGAAGGLGNDGTLSAPILGLQNFYGSAGGAGTAGIVTVSQTGNVSVTGGQAVGIFAQSTTGQGVSKAVTITTAGDINAVGVSSFGILAQSLGKQNSNALLSSDNIAITVNSGTIRGGVGAPPPGAVSLALTENEKGAAINFRDGRNNTLTNRGTVGDTSDVTRMAILAEVGNEAISNFGTVAGNLNLGGGTNTFVNQTTGTLASGPSVKLGSGGALTNHGTLSVGGQNKVAQTALSGVVTQSTTGRMLIDVDFSIYSADRIDITSGNAALSGSLVLNRMNAQTIKPGTTQLALVTATGGVTNSGLAIDVAPSAITNYGLTTTAATSGSPGQLLLTIATNFAPSSLTSAMTANQNAMGNYFNGVATVGTPSGLVPIVQQIIAQNDVTKLAKLYDGLSPDTHLAAQSMPYYDAMRFSEALLSCKQLDGDYRFSSEGNCAWMSFTPNWRQQDSVANLPIVKSNGMGLAGGFQHQVADHLHFGLGASYDTSTIESVRPNTNSLSQRARGQGGTLGAVLKADIGPNTVSLSASGGQMNYEVGRYASQAGPTVMATSEQTVNMLAAHLRYALLLEAAQWYAKPGLDVGYTSLTRGSFQELGAGATSLNVEGMSNRFTTIQPMLEIGGEMSVDSGARLRLFGRGSLTQLRAGEDTELTATFRAAPAGTDPFTVTQTLDKRTLDLTAGFDFLGVGGTVLRVSYTDSKSNTVESRGANLKISLPVK